MKKLIATSLFAAALAFAGQTAAVAQSNDGYGPGFGMMGGGCPMMGMMGHGMMGRGFGMMGQGWGWGQGMMGARQARMAAVVDGRLAYLKGELGITDAQKDAWEAYAKAVHDRVDQMQDLHRTMWETMQKGGALERMDARIKGMQAMVDAMSAVKPAIETLYGTLSDEQKKIADDMIGLDCGAM